MIASSGSDRSSKCEWLFALLESSQTPQAYRNPAGPGEEAVFLGEEGRLSILAALDDVMRHIDQGCFVLLVADAGRDRSGVFRPHPAPLV
jgi:hypothetical protein